MQSEGNNSLILKLKKESSEKQSNKGKKKAPLDSSWTLNEIKLDKLKKRIRN